MLAAESLGAAVARAHAALKVALTLKPASNGLPPVVLDVVTHAALRPDPEQTGLWPTVAAASARPTRRALAAASVQADRGAHGQPAAAHRVLARAHQRVRVARAEMQRAGQLRDRLFINQ